MLTFGTDRADFQPDDGPGMVIDGVSWVARGYRDTVYPESAMASLDGWIQVRYGDEGAPSVVYLQDRRWHGLAAVLPPHKLLNAFRSLAR